MEYQEGRWTFYIPPQFGLQEHFAFVGRYPQPAGLKILKDFRHPDSAKYTRHMQSPAPGAALKRLLTPSPKALVRIANYLYFHDLGMKVYDLAALEGRDRTLSAYIVEHLAGAPVTQDAYETFMYRIRALLNRRELTTVHESVDIMADFAPPDCSRNLVMSEEKGRPLYVDFQGFLFKDEKRLIDDLLGEVNEKEEEGRSFFRSTPGNVKTRWCNILKIMEAVGFSFHERVVYDIGCNTGSFLYYALSEGAQWAIGWDRPEVVASAERLLLGLGATRFDLFGRENGEDPEFKSDIPERYKTDTRGILFCHAPFKGVAPGISEIPWEYMLLEGYSGRNLEEPLEYFRDVPGVRNWEVLTHRSFADGDSPTGVILLRRERRETLPVRKT